MMEDSIIATWWVPWVLEQRETASAFWAGQQQMQLTENTIWRGDDQKTVITPHAYP
jgi:hypothetical protein